MMREASNEFAGRSMERDEEILPGKEGGNPGVLHQSTSLGRYTKTHTHAVREYSRGTVRLSTVFLRHASSEVLENGGVLGVKHVYETHVS